MHSVHIIIIIIIMYIELFVLSFRTKYDHHKMITVTEYRYKKIFIVIKNW